VGAKSPENVFTLEEIFAVYIFTLAQMQQLITSLYVTPLCLLRVKK